MKKSVKGQMIFEFIVAAVLFIGIIIYVINHMSYNVSVFSEDFYTNKLENKAAQIVELLVRNEGMWSGGEPQIIGLSEQWPVLNYSKIMMLKDYCSNPENYARLLNDFGLEKRIFSITPEYLEMRILVSGDAGTVLDCKAGSLPDKPKAIAKRYALNESGEILTVSVWLW